MSKFAERLQKIAPPQGDGSSTPKPKLEIKFDGIESKQKTMILKQSVRAPKALDRPLRKHKQLKGEEPTFFERHERKLYIVAVLACLAGVAWIMNQL
jgi:hypothetical protein